MAGTHFRLLLSWMEIQSNVSTYQILIRDESLTLPS